jgi:uncharacterized protein (DUF4415 family)
MSEERIVRYTRDQIPADGGTDWARVLAMTDEEIERNAADDPENPLLTAEELARLEPVRPEDRAKVPVYIRLDPDIVDFFKSGGPGYQTRINAALREHMQRALQRQWRRAGP